MDKVDFRTEKSAMPRAFLTDEAKAALTAAIRDLESQSSAELVIAVRPRSAAYLRVPLTAALVAAFATLAALLYTPWDFPLAWFLADPALAALVAFLAARSLPAAVRLGTRQSSRRERVERAAKALFVDKGIHRTSGRTGILVYVSLLERELALVPDIAVEPVAADDGWKRIEGRIAAAMAGRADGSEVAALLRELGPVLAGPLPRLEDDVDELPDEVM
jgi:putative membrane protein